MVEAVLAPNAVVSNPKRGWDMTMRIKASAVKHIINGSNESLKC